MNYEEYLYDGSPKDDEMYEKDEKLFEDTEESHPHRTRYFRWVDPANHETVEISGSEYFAFILDPKNKDRYFVGVQDLNGESEMLVFETTKEDFDRCHSERTMYWRKKALNDDEKNDDNKSDEKYRGRKPIPNYIIVSLDEDISNDDSEESMSLHEIIADPDSDFEEKLTTQILVRQAVAALPSIERELINLMHFKKSSNLNGVQIARRIGIPNSTFNFYKERAYAELRNILSGLV